MKNITLSERGVSILELAIILPVVLILISGMIDMGFAISRVKSVVSASRQASRVAASYGKYLQNPVTCGAPVSTQCNALLPLTEAPSVTEVAAHAACEYIGKNAPPRENWWVEVPRLIETYEDGKLFLTTDVGMQYTGRKCFICFHELFGSFEPRSRSSFVLEGTCR